jgi:hypothetical protein
MTLKTRRLKASPTILHRTVVYVKYEHQNQGFDRFVSSVATLPHRLYTEPIRNLEDARQGL